MGKGAKGDVGPPGLRGLPGSIFVLKDENYVKVTVSYL